MLTYSRNTKTDFRILGKDSKSEIQNPKAVGFGSPMRSSMHSCGLGGKLMQTSKVGYEGNLWTE